MAESAAIPLNLGAALRRAVHELEPTSSSPRLDAETLLMQACGLDRSELIVRHDQVLSENQRQVFEILLTRRRQGEPVAYLTGEREFWSLPLKVTPDTLIPRPDTELLVEKALARIPADATWQIADLGTGSGAIALAVARERPQCRVLATDISAPALAVAAANAQRLGVTNVEWFCGDWFVPLANTTLNLIVANPPYVRADDPHLCQGDVRFEPCSALAAGADGLEAIRRITHEALDFLAPDGWLLLEHGWDQPVAVVQLLRRRGYRDIVSYPDLAGHPRVTEGRR